MLTLYHSNQLELLKTLIAELIRRDPLTDAFTTETILVQSPGMAQWLQLELADELNIAANIDFTLPVHFISSLYHSLFSETELNVVYEHDIMHWQLFSLLPELLTEPVFKPLFTYLSAQQNTQKDYQLVNKLADLFDQYQIYRSDWINAWTENRQVAGLGEEQLWQSALWRKLKNRTAGDNNHLYRNDIHQKIIHYLSQPIIQQNKLPKRLFICGNAVLPPLFLQILQLLSQHIPVHVMLTNPCRYYWNDLYNIKWLAKQTKQRIDNHELSDITDEQFNKQRDMIKSNPLLALWGNQGRDHLSILQSIDPKHEINAFVEQTPDSLLHHLQQNILAGEEGNLAKTSLAVNDHSLSFHACHSIQREVEILYDQLLMILDHDSTLQPRDIIVMVADIDCYAPYIQAVFSHPPKTRYLPFSIADRKLASVDPIIRTFLSLLSLSRSRYTVEEIFGLFENPACADRFSLNEKAIAQLHQWIEDTGIRWGLDDLTAKAFDLPTTHKNTWQFGLKRMLLGYAMNSHSGVWKDILPYDNSSGLIADLIGHLATLLERLIYWRETLSKPHLLVDWLPLCHKLLDDFFINDTTTEATLSFISQEWLSALQHGIDAQYDQLVNADIIMEIFRNRFEQSAIKQPFLAGKINFCTLMPMRSIPFNMVCLLGMNDGVYPRIHIPQSFDLMVTHPRKGDRNRRSDDYYLFLEALLSAREYVYISYIGHSIQDNSLRYPSIIVAELQNYLVDHFFVDGDQSSTDKKQREKLQQHLIIEHPRMPFDPRNFHQNSAQQSYADEWLPTATGKNYTILPQAILPFKMIEEIDTEQLKRFFRHSVKTFFQQRLGVFFPKQDTILSNNEPFALTALQRYQFNEKLLMDLIFTQDTHQQQIQLLNSGTLPYGEFGEITVRQQYETMLPLAEKIKSQLDNDQTIEIDLTIHHIRLYGWLTHIQQNGLLRWHAGTLSILDALSLWIDHLLYAVLGFYAPSRLYGRQNSIWRFDPIEQSEATHLLSQLIDGYQQGMNTPLLFPVMSAWSWLNGTDNPTNEQEETSRQKLLNNWLATESHDLYYQRLVKTLTDDNINAIKRTALHYLSPLKIYGHTKET